MRDTGRGHASGSALSAFLDDELAEADAATVTRHVAACPSCLAELERLRTTRAALRGLPPVAPPSALFDAAAARAAIEHDRLVSRVRAIGAVTLGLIAILATSFLAGGEDGDVVPPVDVFTVDHVVRTGGGAVPMPVELRRTSR